MDPVIEAYKKDIDRTLLTENLRLSVEDRFLKFESFMKGVMELRAAGALSRREQSGRSLTTPEPHGRGDA